MSRSYLSCLKNISSYIPYDGIASIIVPIINIDAPFFSSSSSSKKIRLFVTRGKFSSRKFIAIFRFLSPIISSISKILLHYLPISCKLCYRKIILTLLPKKKKIKQVSYNLASQLTKTSRYFWNSNQLKKMTKNYIRPIFINFWTWLEFKNFTLLILKKKNWKNWKKKKERRNWSRKQAKTLEMHLPPTFSPISSLPVEEKWADVWQLYSRLIATGTPAERSS